MKPEKKIKRQIIEKASSNPEKYYPVSELKKLGLKRQKCSNCGTMFWSSVDRNVCGDTSCVHKYSFIGNTPAKKEMEFAETYKLFKLFMEKRGYFPVNRFPIVARWRDDLDFNIASIIGFQPYVTKGIVSPPSELLTIPQNCLRFSDIDNVGYTGRHGTNFVMIGQCAFKKPKEYNQAKYFRDLFEWFTEVMKIPKDEIQIHEDAWVGGGDCGPSMEFFSRGLELANQVYMSYDMKEANDISELKPLKIKVLDMGMGLERCCWFSKGSLNQYEASMPKVSKYLFQKTGLKPNWDLYKKFLPYSGNLNLDEISDILIGVDKNGKKIFKSGIESAWEDIAKKIGGITAEELKNEIEPIAGLYSIADHTKTLLYAITDGALPSNVKGGYNLRLVLRRALDFIDRFNWDIDLFEVIKLHSEEVRELYPEMRSQLEDIKKIIDLEVLKYKTHREKIENKILNLIKKEKSISKNSKEVIIKSEDFIKYYISDGITPEEIKTEFAKKGVDLEIPSNFFTLVNEFFESKKREQINNNKEIKFLKYIRGIKETELLFYKDSFKEDEVVNIVKEFKIGNEKFIVLDKTLFYPTMGGQSHDIGFIGSRKVVDVLKVGNIIIHQVE